jgi:hypothetical protein
MIKKNENCLYCGEKMESETAKKKFCSDKCRVYFGRELKAKIAENNKPENKARILEERNTIKSTIPEPFKINPETQNGWDKKENYKIIIPKETKQKKEMPSGLDKLGILRWHRENP